MRAVGHYKAIYALVGILVGVPLVSRAVIFQPYRQQSEVMLPTIRPGDVVVVNRWSCRLREPMHGDIVALSILLPAAIRSSSKPHITILRVVGLPGDVVEVHDGVLRVDGKRVDEPYLLEPGRIRYSIRPQRVPEGTLFVLGDNRNNSIDSHVYGPVPRKWARGKMWRHVRACAGPST